MFSNKDLYFSKFAENYDSNQKNIKNGKTKNSLRASICLIN